jgi:hypothetical protein
MPGQSLQLTPEQKAKMISIIHSLNIVSAAESCRPGVNISQPSQINLGALAGMVHVHVPIHFSDDQLG